MRSKTIQPVPSELRRESRHQVLARDIREQIRSGRLLPGDQLPSFNELRGRWGVGRDTLERMYAALQRDGLIVREHRRGIFVSDPQLPRTGGTVGFVVHSEYQSHPYYARLLEGVRREAEKCGLQILLLSENSPVDWGKVDGVIHQYTLGGVVDGGNAPVGLPRVVLIYPRTSFDSAVADDYPGMRQAVEHLLELGHRRIAFLTMELQPHSMSRDRIAAYKDALAAAGAQALPGWARCMHEPEKTGRIWETTGYDDMRDWLHGDWDELGCTAVLAHNDEAAIGVIAALQDVGLRVPEDVSVVGFDGTEIANAHRPRLTTVRVPLEEIGACGFNLLQQQLQRSVDELQQERSPRHVALATRLHVGQSSGPAHVGRNNYVQ